MRILVDADACPKVIKEILYRTAKRREIETLFIANAHLFIPASPYLKHTVVEKGFDKADAHIVSLVQKGDLVITEDVPLASAVIEKEGLVITPRGSLYNKDNIAERLLVRNMMEDMRNAQEISGGPPPLSNRNKEAFSNALDKWLTHQKK